MHCILRALRTRRFARDVPLHLPPHTPPPPTHDPPTNRSPSTPPQNPDSTPTTTATNPKPQSQSPYTPQSTTYPRQDTAIGPKPTRSTPGSPPFAALATSLLILATSSHLTSIAVALSTPAVGSRSHPPTERPTKQNNLHPKHAQPNSSTPSPLDPL